jgi:selenocysteine lyase/cysteine desulfurase
LYANKDVLGSARITEPPTIDHFAAPWVDASSYTLAPTARRFEQWESNYAGLCSLGVAIQYATELGIDEWIWPRVRGLGSGLRTRLLSISPKVQVHDLGSDDGGTRCGIVTFSVAGVDSAAIKAHLLKNGIYVAVSPSTSTLLDAQRRALPGDGLVRASVSYINTEEELDRAAICLADLLASL